MDATSVLQKAEMINAKMNRVLYDIQVAVNAHDVVLNHLYREEYEEAMKMLEIVDMYMKRTEKNILWI